MSFDLAATINSQSLNLKQKMAMLMCEGIKAIAESHQPDPEHQATEGGDIYASLYRTELGRIAETAEQLRQLIESINH